MAAQPLDGHRGHEPTRAGAGPGGTPHENTTRPGCPTRPGANRSRRSVDTSAGLTVGPGAPSSALGPAGIRRPRRTSGLPSAGRRCAPRCARSRMRMAAWAARASRAGRAGRGEHAAAAEPESADRPRLRTTSPCQVPARDRQARAVRSLQHTVSPGSSEEPFGARPCPVALHCPCGHAQPVGDLLRGPTLPDHDRGAADPCHDGLPVGIETRPAAHAATTAGQIPPSSSSRTRTPR